MVSPEKIQEMRAVVNFWKSRVDETKHQLQRLQVRQETVPAEDRCGHSIMVTLIDMKSRELADSQRGLRRAQANLGRALETSMPQPVRRQVPVTAIPTQTPPPMPTPAPTPTPTLTPKAGSAAFPTDSTALKSIAVAQVAPTVKTISVAPGPSTLVPSLLHPGSFGAHRRSA